MKHLLIVGLLMSFGVSALAQFPSGFAKTTLHSESSTIVGVTFDDNDRLYFWEKSGKVWTMHNGHKVSTPVIDISSQVRDYWDLGLIGFCLDPDYLNNGFIYLAFAMDETLFPGYNVNEPATQMRVARFTVGNPIAHAPSATVSSQVNLVGNLPGEGPPILFHGHMGGALAFGDDGSLLVTSGDGALFDNHDNGSTSGTFYQQALTLGIITASENIGSNRCQYDQSLSGKVLRIDPSTGQGLPGNPMYNAADPSSKESTIYAKGLRNPWKIDHIPNTGNHSNPGKFIIGEVGSIYHDELLILDQAGTNYGWPHYEGFDKTISGRLSQYQPTTWEKPKIDMRSQLRGKVGNNHYQVGSSQFPGDNITNNWCIVSGLIYDKSQFPSEYHNALFFGDHSSNRIYYTKLDANDDPQFCKQFGSTGERIYDMSYPNNEDAFYYVGGNANGTYSTINKITYSSGNLDPVAVIDADTTNGGGEVSVRFTADLSYDPDPNDVLTYHWNFSDGQSATGLAPSVRFQATSTNYESIKAVLTVTDNHNAFSKDSLYISLNNSAPTISGITTSPIIGHLTPLQPTPVNISALVSDDQTPLGNLVYNWEVYEVHNGHVHLQDTHTGNPVSLNLPATFCSPASASYWARVVLKVTDANGVFAEKHFDFEPNCGLATQTLTFPSISTKNTASSPFALNASSSASLPITYYKVSGPIGLLGNNCSLLGIPGFATIRATQHGNSTTNPAFLKEQSFKIVKPRTAQAVSLVSPTALLQPNTSYILTGSSSLGRNVKFLLVNGDGTVAGNTLTTGSNTPEITVRVFEEGDFNIQDAFLDTTFEVCTNDLIVAGIVNPSQSLSFKAKNTISSSQKIHQGHPVGLSAKKSITFTQGFEAMSGSVFYTDFTGCGNN